VNELFVQKHITNDKQNGQVPGVSKSRRGEENTVWLCYKKYYYFCIEYRRVLHDFIMQLCKRYVLEATHEGIRDVK